MEIIDYIGPIVETTGGIVLIGGYFYLPERRKDFKTMPAYGMATFIEGWSVILPEPLTAIFSGIAFIILFGAIYTDYKSKTGLCLILSKRK